MFCHDAQHTGRSPYIAKDNNGLEKWRFKTFGWAGSSPVVDANETIYIGSYDLYSINSNGTLKWKYDTGGVIQSCSPAIDENGILYVGTQSGIDDYLYAIYTENGNLKWKYQVSDISTSPVIAEDGSIIFADSDNWNIISLYPNGTKKWSYHTNNVIYSSPAIGPNGTIYCGSHDNYIYALNPNDGTLKWKYKTGSWVHGTPSISKEGIIYCGSDDGYLYALAPNGSLYWKLNVGAIRGSPSIDEEGNLYIGVWEEKIYSIYPDGTIKWTLDVGERIWDSSVALSADGTLYFGTCNLESEGGLDIVALYSNGTLKWRRHIGSLFSSPCIGSDGTVFIGASTVEDGYLYAFGPLDPDAPYIYYIFGPVTAKAGIEHNFEIVANSPIDKDIFCYVDWGDGTIEEWIGPYKSNQKINLDHTWKTPGDYFIKARAKDTDNLWGPWKEFNINIFNSRPKISLEPVWMHFLDMFPVLQRILDLWR
jgi:outer membrane protein assembly factor BamB